MIEFKTCSKCGEVKAVSEFYARRGDCKTCTKVRVTAWKKANPGKVASKKYVRKKESPEKVASRNSDYYKANSEKLASYKATYYKENHEIVAAKNAAWSKANPEKVASQNAAWSKANLEKVAARNSAMVSEMSPAYVAGRLGIPLSVLTHDLLFLKREQLVTHRLSRQITQAIKAQGASA